MKTLVGQIRRMIKTIAKYLYAIKELARIGCSLTALAIVVAKDMLLKKRVVH